MAGRFERGRAQRFGKKLAAARRGQGLASSSAPHDFDGALCLDLDSSQLPLGLHLLRSPDLLGLVGLGRGASHATNRRARSVELPHGGDEARREGSVRRSFAQRRSQPRGGEDIHDTALVCVNRCQCLGNPLGVIVGHGHIKVDFESARVFVVPVSDTSGTVILLFARRDDILRASPISLEIA